jgi:hypothetical protein
VVLLVYDGQEIDHVTSLEDGLKKSIAIAATAFALAALITPGQAVAADCTASRFCLYTSTNQQGTRVVYNTEKKCYALPHSSQPNGPRSAHNRTDRYWEIYNANGRLLEPVIKPNTKRNFTAGTASAMRELCWYNS